MLSLLVPTKERAAVFTSIGQVVIPQVLTAAVSTPARVVTNWLVERVVLFSHFDELLFRLLAVKDAADLFCGIVHA